MGPVTLWRRPLTQSSVSFRYWSPIKSLYSHGGNEQAVVLEECEGLTCALEIGALWVPGNRNSPGCELSPEKQVDLSFFWWAGNPATCHSMLIPLMDFIFSGVIQQFHESNTMDWEAIKKNFFKLFKVGVILTTETFDQSLNRKGNIYYFFFPGSGTVGEGCFNLGKKNRGTLTLHMWLDCIFSHWSVCMYCWTEPQASENCQYQFLKVRGIS